MIYATFKVDSIADIIYTLVPLAVLMFLVIVIFYKPMHQHEGEEADGEGDEEETNNRPSFSSTFHDSVSFDNHMLDSHYSLHRRSLLSIESTSALAAEIPQPRKSTMLTSRREATTRRRRFSEPMDSLPTNGYNTNNNSKLMNKNPNFETGNQSMAYVKKNSLVVAEAAAATRRKSTDKVYEKKLQHESSSSKTSESTAEFYI